MNRTALAAIGLAALLLAGCGGSSHTPATRSNVPTVPQLRSIQQLRSAFNAHDGAPRLIVLISPT